MNSSPVGAARDPQPVQLSLAQKCDIASQAIAAVITAGLIAAVYLRIVASMQGSGGPQVGTVPSARVAPEEPATVTSLVQPSRVSASKPLRLEPAAARAIKREPSRTPFVRKLAALLTGDGTYTVHPFPGVER